MQSSKTTKRKAGETSSKPTATKKLKTSTSSSRSKNSADKENNDSAILKSWSNEEWLSENNNIELQTAKNLINLFNNDNSIPFIARYRRDLTKNMQAEELRNVKESYETLKLLDKKLEKVVSCLKERGVFKHELKDAVMNARTIDELDHIYAPYKPGAVKSLSERAKEQGLEEAANSYLNNKSVIDLKLVAHEKSLSLDDVKDGVINIIIHVICHDTECLKNIRKWKAEARDIFIETKLASSSKSSKKEETKSDSEKFLNYSNFKCSTKFVQPYQVLAINRGESLKVLKVKITVSERIYFLFCNFCKAKWFFNQSCNPARKNILDEAIKKAFQKYLSPLITRQVRSDLKLVAEKASVKVFENNLKNMLLAQPCKDRILSIDPGYKHGCKYALISETGSVVVYGVLYPQFKSDLKKDVEGLKLKEILEKHNCLIVAIGNGTACRETETWITNLKTNNILPSDVKYTIVIENGASIYSCSPEAKKEFPNLDTNIISAISIARRLQDPLSELIKIEPKHLGVGMYQHDIKEKLLTESLDEITMECVSFVGVNLNTASACLLSKIAGLSKARSENLIKHREKICFFKNRQQLLDVKGIGAKVFEQCAGFLRIAPISQNSEESFYKQADVNRLDRTWIHPESYNIAKRFLKSCSVSLKDIGTQNCIDKVKTYIAPRNITELTKEFKTTENVIQLIIEALTKPIDHDFRQDLNQKPLFKKGCTSIHELKPGDILTGRIQNVTDFGSFVDVGVGKDGLIHKSNTKGISLQLGDTVEVEVKSIEASKGRIGLLLKSVLGAEAK